MSRVLQLARSMRSRLAFATAAASLAAGLALAQAPSFSGPSIARVSESATFRGGALPPNAALTVFVTAPGGATAGYGAVADSSGALQYVFAASETGTYTLALADSGGRTLASAVIAVMP